MIDKVKYDTIKPLERGKMSSSNHDYLKLLDPSKVHNSVFDRKFMYLSDIIDPLYHEYAIRLEKTGHTLDLDVLRRHHQVENYAEVTKILATYFDFAQTSNEKGNIVISMTTMKNTVTDLSPVEYCVTVKDTSVIMNLEQREKFAILGARIRSRLGYGTILQIPIIEPYDKI